MAKFQPAPTLAAGLLRLARDRTGLTQSALAARAGVAQQSISAYETGRKEPTLPTLTRLLAAAGLEMRIHLEPISDHDRSLEEMLESLDPSERAGLDSARVGRAGAARLRRLRGG